MEELEKKLEEQVSRLAALDGPQDKRIKKRVLQSIGKLKRKISEVTVSVEPDPTIFPAQRPSKLQKVENRLGSLSKKQMKAKVKLLNDELSRLAHKKMPSEALKRLHAAVRRGLAADVHSYTNTIHAFVRCNDIRGALGTLNDMKSAGISPNVVTYTTLMRGYCELHEVRTALDLISSEDIEVNIRTVNTLLRGCQRTGDIASALKIYRYMGERWNVPKDESALEYMIAILCQGLRIDDAEKEVMRFEIESPIAQLHGDHEEACPFQTMSCPVYLAMCRTALILSDYEKARLYLRCASHLHQNARTAQLRKSMMKRSKELGERNNIDTSRGTDLFLRHRREEIGYELALLERSLVSRVKLFNIDQPQILMTTLNCNLRMLHFEKGQPNYFDTQSEENVHARNASILYNCRHSYGLSNLLRKITHLIECPNLKLIALKKVLGSIKMCSPEDTRWAVVDLKTVFDSLALSKSGSALLARHNRDLPLKLEICSGAGEWVCSQAKHDNGSANWISMELRSDRCHQILSRAIFEEISNLAIICCDACELLSTWFPLHQVSELFINHPQPPEHIDRGKATNSQNQGKHLLTAHFFKILHKSLLPGGKITIVTDNQSYARMLLRIISDDVGQLFQPGTVEETDCIREDFLLDYSTTNNTDRAVSKFSLWRGNPDSRFGHNAKCSSYFDRMWDKGKHCRRWILFISAI